ncbi:hypothetical protein [Serratia odorifera]|uniref:DUF551 domain-containing protein n=2 Tax=Serratia odorifera TaxID=618 RepID=D4DVX1_SEROD|nr:hypothetical protein [Serratia odorifera]EFE98274.1 hypothetical protein HMPREF0758_0071 [Serratia odorifera DSM 4582]PNK92674.1 hypothetical protein CEQ31_025020 [Serratia odorifera]RII73857.1 hypothetical protein DX901_01505 [Serratia odorifera]VDZ51579.1 Uncharacterised protein [Serratia odorifera]
MTLTTERLHEIVERRSPSLRWGEAEQIAAELLVNREAQSVIAAWQHKGEPWRIILDRNIEEVRKNSGSWNPLYTAPPAPAMPDDTRDALRYRFLKDKDAWGCDNEPGLVEWDDLIDLEGNEFDAAIDARISNSDVDYTALTPSIQDQIYAELYRLREEIKGPEDSPYPATVAGGACLANAWAEGWNARNAAVPPPVPDDLIMQVRRLVHALKKANPDHALVKQVPDYMRRKGYWKVTDCLRDAAAAPGGGNG